MTADSPLFSQASWIASPVVGGKRTSAPVPFLRKSFRLERPVKSAQLHITALGLYECEINGQRVGDEVFTPGWTDYRTRVQFQTYGVTEFLRHGENALGAILGDGWYCGSVAWCGRQMYGDRPRLLARLEVILDDDSTVNITSDSSWKTTTGPILESDMLMGESYDARFELGAWSRPGYNDSSWQSVIIAPPDGAVEIVPRVGPPVRRIEEIKPVKEARRGVWHSSYRFFDFGQNFAGRVRISVKAVPGTNLRIRFSEVTNPDGTPYMDNLREARCTDFYTCRSCETETWESLFTFHGFRYVEVQGLSADHSLEVTGIVLHSDMHATGTFRCSHEGLNQLQHNIIWGQKSNFLEVPTDCPQRDERLGWTGDAQVFVRTAAFNMNIRGFFHKWMQDLRDAQSAAGCVPPIAPVPWIQESNAQDGGPAWSDATIICPWTIYLCYGDKKILEDHYESMQRFLTYLQVERCHGLIRNHPKVYHGGYGDWLALDGGGKTEGITPFDLIGTAFYAHSADLLSKIAELLGRPTDAKMYRALHREIVAAFQKRFVTAEGLVVSGTQTSYILALHFNLVPASLRATTAEELVRKIESQGNHLGTGFVGTPYILDVLEEAGRLDLAYTLLEQETFPSWLFPVRNGATTIWERWDGWTPEKGFQDKGMNSFNHYAYGAVGSWMYRSVAGLDLDVNSPGYTHIIFRPRPGGSITWAEAKLQTQHGLAGIRWDLQDDTLKVQLTVPPGAKATFQPPAGYRAAESNYAGGIHHLAIKSSIS